MIYYVLYTTKVLCSRFAKKHVEVAARRFSRAWKVPELEDGQLVLFSTQITS